jgi:hypothetical protein
MFKKFQSTIQIHMLKIYQKSIKTRKDRKFLTSNQQQQTITDPYLDPWPEKSTPQTEPKTTRRRRSAAGMPPSKQNHTHTGLPEEAESAHGHRPAAATQPGRSCPAPRGANFHWRSANISVHWSRMTQLLSWSMRASSVGPEFLRTPGLSCFGPSGFFG